MRQSYLPGGIVVSSARLGLGPGRPVRPAVPRDLAETFGKARSAWQRPRLPRSTRRRHMNMAYLAARGDKSAEMCRTPSRADALVLITGFRYGSLCETGA